MLQENEQAMPRLSVCIPAYNQVEHLKQTIDSILRQTYTDYEVIITDDSRNDMVKNFIDSYDVPGKIKYYKNKEQLGTPENWNEAIRKSSGEYIKILHHDDWLNYDDSLEKYVALLDKNPGTDFAFSATQAIDPRKSNWVHSITAGDLEGLRDNPLLLYQNNLIGAPSNCIFRRGKLLFDPKLKWLVDIEFYIRQLTANKNIAYTNELLSVTFLAEGRVSDFCADNKEVEVFEYLYVLNQVYNKGKEYSRAALHACALKAINVCRSYDINNLTDIAECGYHDELPGTLKVYFILNKFSAIAKKRNLEKTDFGSTLYPS